MALNPQPKTFSALAPLIIQKYERYLPSAFDNSLSMLEKVNMVIEFLNQTGVLIDDMITEWNRIVDWIINDGIEEAVDAEIQILIDNGFFENLINDTIFNDLNTRISSWAYNALYPFPSNLPKVVLDGTDNTQQINDVIHYVMTNGGGEVFFPPGEYIINGTVYTHFDDYTLDDSWSHLTLRGATPLAFSLYSAKPKNATIFKKTNAGNIIETNHTATQDNVLPNGALFRNFTMENIMFQGTGTKDAVYTTMYASTEAINAIQLHRTSAFIRDCLFDIVARGVYAKNSQAEGGDNYCDQTTIERCGFRNIGQSWIEASVADASNFRELFGYRMAKTCQWGVRVVKGTSFKIDTVLCSGREMQLCPNFNAVSLYFANSVTINNVYLENVTSPHINLEQVDNVDINGMGCRHYRGTLVKGRFARNVKIDNVYSYVEEDKKLSATDNGSFTTYDTITPPNDYDWDNSCYNIVYGEMHQYIHASHSSPSFPKVSERYFPKTPKVAYGERGTSFGLVVFGENGGIIISVNGQRIANPENLIGATVPTFNTTTGEITFPSQGIFGSSPFITAVGRRSANVGNKLINAYAVNNQTFRLTDASTGAIITDINDVALNITVRF